MEVTPYECPMACYADGWRPRWISDEAADHIFLKRQSRTVQLGRITIDGEIYEHAALLDLHKKRVDCRFNPLELDVILVYLADKFLCAAHPVEYSSMKDEDLARRKIVEKRTKRKAVADGFRAMIKSIRTRGILQDPGGREGRRRRRRGEETDRGRPGEPDAPSPPRSLPRRWSKWRP